ncbi:hypothetical protein [Undibacterium parvum]|uniref:Uncharacterized protein n=1 Tax=Undibacterium parvum TaxID=401471 RepID=A0A3Q9BQY0_9BURK|nr:hypothetical protein [Undibacterium parvum]AZP12295.1 hypothetical protein EJN92_09960 [Undibacterium parvum]
MQSPTFAQVIKSLRQTSLEFFALARQVFQYLMTLAMPNLILACLGAALLLSILPLALSLFIAFLLIKLVVLLCVLKPKQTSNQ